ncbi:hypothetical protein PGSY75_1239400 [Plasmodium gaboni]|uniref:Uncharacterized protein n=1 Tax=Plasmodium gaboni TaxID=647221 RepID=A0A151LGT8_9APIC|nr:hypothetical protein PGSY75_1239400 [Plasmodium gaboni]KYN98188.1 hypothetical protein PGSY75_1239400 [Plasmodium gaboni]
MKNVYYFIFFCSFLIWVNSMNPLRQGNENFSEKNSSDEYEYVDSAYPGFNIHYNLEPKDWKHIELIEKNNKQFMMDIKEEIKRMEEDKKKINYILNVQKQQFQELLFLIDHKKHNHHNINIDEMPNFLKKGTFHDEYNNKLNENQILQAFKDIDNYTLDNYKYIGQQNFYYHLAQQWIP